jgi:hypothetical protein
MNNLNNFNYSNNANNIINNNNNNKKQLQTQSQDKPLFLDELMKIQNDKIKKDKNFNNKINNTEGKN